VEGFVSQLFNQFNKSEFKQIVLTEYIDGNKVSTMGTGKLVLSSLTDKAIHHLLRGERTNLQRLLPL